MLVFIQKSKKQLHLFGSFSGTLSSAYFFLFISGIIVVRLISPRSLCYSSQAFSALSKRRNSFGWFLQKGNKIHGFVFVIYGEGTVQKVSVIFSKQFKFGLNK